MHFSNTLWSSQSSQCKAWPGYLSMHGECPGSLGSRCELHSAPPLPSVCNNLEAFSSESPFLCMDLSYITALLKDGFGFADSTVLQVRGGTPGHVACCFPWGCGEKELRMYLVIRAARGGIKRDSRQAVDRAPGLQREPPECTARPL